jgi:phage terminase large subunit
MYIETTALRKLHGLTKRIHGIQGGTSASKTISILQILIDKCQRDTTPRLTSVTSESFPHLKRGAMRDFKDIMMSHGYWNESRWNATDFIYTFETGTPLEFFSLDMPHKVRGPRRKRLFINEANNVPYETFDQLEVRTEDEIWLDWNPVTPFWWHEGENGNIAVSSREDADGVILTYLDNEGLPESIVKSIEARKHNKNWWKVYGEGQLGEAEGRIYTGWSIIDEVPEYARLSKYGLDFGYSNDPAAISAVYEADGGFVLDEILYQKGMSNKQIADVLLHQLPALVIADSAEPKSIDEIKSYGINIIPALKGADSRLYGIQYLQQQKIWVTKRSVNLIKEYRNYLWVTDKNGKILNVPEEGWDHLLDAVRYAIVVKKPTVFMPQSVGGVKRLYDGLPG